MKKIQILALHLNYGGIEKAISDLANNLSDDYIVEIVSTYKLSSKPAYKLNKNIKVTYLINELVPNREEFKKNLKSFHFIKAFKEGIKSIKILYLKKQLMKKYIKKSNADVMISTRAFHNGLVSRYASRDILRIAWEHSHHQGNKKYFNKVLLSSRKLDYLVLVSKGLYKDYNSAMKKYSCKCVYIPNMVDVNSPLKSKLKSRRLINTSRFSKEKGLYDLIDVISIVKGKIPNISLDLIGDGVLYNDIKTYIKNKSLEDNVKLYGFKDTDFINDKLSDSSLYVMTSFTESFGISLVEAFSHGVPAIAFNCASGATELITNNGVLVENRDKELMANKIIELLSDHNKLSKYGDNAYNAYKEFTPDKVIEIWIDIIK